MARQPAASLGIDGDIDLDLEAGLATGVDTGASSACSGLILSFQSLTLPDVLHRCITHRRKGVEGLGSLGAIQGVPIPLFPRVE